MTYLLTQTLSHLLTASGHTWGPSSCPLQWKHLSDCKPMTNKHSPGCQCISCCTLRSSWTCVKQLTSTTHNCSSHTCTGTGAALIQVRCSHMYRYRCSTRTGVAQSHLYRYRYGCTAGDTTHRNINKIDSRLISPQITAEGLANSCRQKWRTQMAASSGLYLAPRNKALQDIFSLASHRLQMCAALPSTIGHKFSSIYRYKWQSSCGIQFNDVPMFTGLCCPRGELYGYGTQPTSNICLFIHMDPFVTSIETNLNGYHC